MAQAVVVLDPGEGAGAERSGQERLVAYVVGVPGDPAVPAAGELRARLARTLPPR